uniref:hypothetical protein n=1 Tax=Candidatus Electrothrix sp. TaxID=2170559 RepID=UPI0040572113
DSKQPSVRSKHSFVGYQQPFAHKQKSSPSSGVIGKTYQISLQQYSKQEGKHPEARVKTLYLSHVLRKFKQLITTLRTIAA